MGGRCFLPRLLPPQAPPLTPTAALVPTEKETGEDSAGGRRPPPSAPRAPHRDGTGEAAPARESRLPATPRPRGAESSQQSPRQQEEPTGHKIKGQTPEEPSQEPGRGGRPVPGGRQPGLWAGSPPPTLPAGPPPPKTVPGPPRAPPWPGPPACGARVGVLPNRMQERGTRQPGAMSCPRQGDGYPWSARQASETCAPGTILPKSYAAPPQPLPGARGSRGERCLCRSAPLTLPSRLRSPPMRHWAPALRALGDAELCL